MWSNLEETADLVTLTEEILDWKLHILSHFLQQWQKKNKTEIIINLFLEI